MIRKLLLPVLLAVAGQAALAQTSISLKQARSTTTGKFPLADSLTVAGFWQPATGSEYLIVQVPDNAMASSEFLYLDVANRSPWLSMLYISLFDEKPDPAKPQPALQIKVGLQPEVPARVVVPFSYFDNNSVFMKRQPRVMKGQVMGRAIQKTAVKYIGLHLTPGTAPWQSQLQFLGDRQLVFSPTAPPPVSQLDDRINKNLKGPEAQQKWEYLSEAVVDKFGQKRLGGFKGKCRSEDELKQRVTTYYDGIAKAEWPSEFSKYGGWKGKQFKATGFYRTEFDGKRWWLADPEGYAFVSTGMDCARPDAASPIDQLEDFYDWLPAQNDPLAKAIATGKRGAQQVDFVRMNQQRVFGEKWKDTWHTNARNLLVKAGFNTIGNWSDEEFIKAAGLPYVWPLSNFPTTKKLLFRDFPDVFSPEYRTNAKKFAEQLKPLANDKLMIGYFLRNEPEWAFGDHNIALEMMRGNPGCDSRIALAGFIKKRYKNINQLNHAWGQKLKSFADLETVILPEPHKLPEAAKKDLYAFSEVLVDEYLRVPCAEVKKVDKNHLNLGMRYAWISSDLCYRAGAFFDVFSINGYNTPGPPQTAEITKRTGKPVMIGEFHFGAVDRGLPATGIAGAATTQDRALAYQYYVEQGMARPEVVGIHYFQFYDQPMAGRFDGENYGIGLLNVLSLPYEELMQGMMNCHKRIYGVAAGQQAPTQQAFTAAPAIY